jgi:ribosomal protein L24
MREGTINITKGGHVVYVNKEGSYILISLVTNRKVHTTKNYTWFSSVSEIVYEHLKPINKLKAKLVKGKLKNNLDWLDTIPLVESKSLKFIEDII